MRASSRVLLSLLFLAAGACSSRPPYQGKSVAALQRMLHDPSAAVRVQGAFGLGRLGAEAQSATPALIEALKSEDSLLRQTAAESLGQIGPPAQDAVPALIDALQDKEWPVRRQAALALKEMGPAGRSALPVLRTQLGKEKHTLVKRAIQDGLTSIQKKASL